MSSSVIIVKFTNNKFYILEFFYKIYEKRSGFRGFVK